jgi:hypothetical protein
MKHESSARYQQLCRAEYVWEWLTHAHPVHSLLELDAIARKKMKELHTTAETAPFRTQLITRKGKISKTQVIHLLCRTAMRGSIRLRL